ncbi:MAG: methionyl-tRNA formyltransferase, partial [Elusimicrobiaceae bacterium]|nr:methionyl-tRNA formyltransferase [Elusimicrobiaceae bacterium]
MKTVFFGTPNIAIPFLEVLHKNSDIQLVITQPDKPRGRGMQISPCETKVKAQELGLEVAHKIPAQINAELGVAVAYGRLIKKETISQFKHGIINIHFSMLPKYRGASPVQYALLNGDTKTGVTAFFIDEGMDTGDIFLQKEIDISPEDTALTLFPKLIEAGTSILKECLAKIEQKNITRTKQTGESSNAPLINKEDYKLNFEQESAEKIHNKIRALGFGKA